MRLHRWLAVVLCASGATAAFCADLHVAPPPLGDDAQNGSAVAPLASLAAAIAAAGSGDRILLRRGGTWREPGLTLPSGVSICAWGTGPLPELTGSTVVTLSGQWAEDADVRTAVVADRVLACWVDGRFVPLARYPNSGWLRCNTGSSVSEIVDPQLPERAAGRWTGAQVRWRRWSWWWETRRIDTDDGGESLILADDDPGLEWANGVDGNSPDGEGAAYIIDDDLDELDAPGEWFWGEGMFYLHPPSWADPQTMVVEIATATDAYTSKGATLRDLALRRFAGRALVVSGASTIERCVFEEIGTNAVHANWGAGGSRVHACVFRDVRNLAVWWNENPGGATGTLIDGNLLHRIGVQPGYGGSGPWHAAGIIISNGNAVVVRRNRIIDTGYAGIILGSDGCTAEDNVLVRCMSTLNDGAGIYTNCNESIIRRNIILDTLGDLSTSHPWWPLGHGIWLEFLQDFRDSEVTANTVVCANGMGIKLPNNYDCLIRDNTCMDARTAAFSMSVRLDNDGENTDGVSEDADDDLRPQNHLVEDNILATVVPTRRTDRPENINKWYLPPYTEPAPHCLTYKHDPDGDPAIDVDYGTMRRTTFIAPAAGAAVIRPKPGDDIDDLATWAAACPSWAEASDRVVRAHSFALINDTEHPASMLVPPGDWTRHDGAAVADRVTVDPLASMVLVSGDAPALAAPYQVASGIDYRDATPLRSIGPDGGITTRRLRCRIERAGSAAESALAVTQLGHRVYAEHEVEHTAWILPLREALVDFEGTGPEGIADLSR
ncbi:MAG: right-handed parallel beta-helix repeat-containing protein [Planctomycetota bacterium]